MQLKINNPVYIWFVVGMLCLANCFSFLDRMILTLLVVPIKQDLHITDTQFSFLHGFAFVIVYATLGLPIARFADRTNRRFLISGGILLWSFATAACGLCQHYWQLFISRACVGVGEATLFPASNSLLGDLVSPTDLAKALAVYSIGVHLGAGIALMAGGVIIGLVSTADPVAWPIIGVLKPWQLVFIYIGIPGILFSFLFLASVREPRRKQSNEVSNNTGTGLRIPPISAVKNHISDYSIFYFNHVAGFAFMMLLGMGVAAWNPAFLMRTYGVSIAEIGLYYGLTVAIFGTTGAIAGGWYVSELFRRGYKDANVRAVLIGFSCSAPFAILYPFMPNTILSLIMYGLFYFFFSSCWGGVWAALHYFSPGGMKAQIIAIVSLVINVIGLGLGPVVIALFTDYFFKNEASLRYSIVLVVTISSILTVFYFYRALKSLEIYFTSK